MLYCGVYSQIQECSEAGGEDPRHTNCRGNKCRLSLEDIAGGVGWILPVVRDFGD